MDPLDSHQARRSAGTPTVTTLVGPPGPAVQTWRAWAGRAGRPIILMENRTLTGLCADLIRSLEDPLAVVAGWAKAAAGLEAGALQGRLGAMTRYDRTVFWRSLAGVVSPEAAACAEHVLRARPEPDVNDSVPGEWAFVRGFGELLGRDRFPAVYQLAPAAAELEAAARWAERFAEEVPFAPVAIVAGSAAYEACVGGAPTRWAALLREGLVRVETVTAEGVSAALRAGDLPVPPEAVDRLAGDGATRQLVASYVRAADALRTHGPDVARSAAEQFLFDRLESLTATAGLFRLNRPLEFRHGPAAAEADLLAGDLRLVVEVDGAYHHLTPDQYRRDRRKDWLLQRHGYLILRFLADDVVSRLADILDTILAAVAFRRGTPSPGSTPPP